MARGGRRIPQQIAGYAEAVGEIDAAEYWHQEADRAERRARRLERGEV